MRKENPILILAQLRNNGIINVDAECHDNALQFLACRPTTGRDENGRKRSEKPLNRSRNCIFLVGNGNGNGKIGRENEIGIPGYRERNQSVGSMPITIGNR